jgi:hypothetical protein
VPPSSVHFNGSVNLPDGETVMREISTRIPSGVRRMTDGETGDRGYWISFQIEKFLAMPEFETVTSGRAYETESDAPEMPRLRLAEGASADTIDWPNLGYADAYAESFETFDRLQQEGTIAAGVRMQAQYPTPIASMAGTVVPEDLPGVAAAYEQALFADLADLLGRLPHERIAVQWDVAVEFGLLEGAFPGAPTLPLEHVAPGLIRAIEQVPEDVPVGMHLCYGDYGHQHFKQPDSLQMQVDVVNAVASGASRPLNWASFTVPQARADAEYFVPLGSLTAGREVELYFALVPYHPDDQAEGTTATQIKHVDAALGEGREWGICTECGMGRANAEDVPRLLDLHREILAVQPA